LELLEKEWLFTKHFESVLHGENSDCKTTIERAADWSQQGLFSL